MINDCCGYGGVPTDDLGEEPEDECAHLRMRDFHSSICFLCVSGVGWILCSGGVGELDGGSASVGGDGTARGGITGSGLARFWSGRAHAMGAC